MTSTTFQLSHADTPLELTDTFGIPLGTVAQPEPGSVLMIDGLHGVAWQRFFSDRKWHSTTGATRSWSSILRQRNVVLIYAASVREGER